MITAVRAVEEFGDLVVARPCGHPVPMARCDSIVDHNLDVKRHPARRPMPWRSSTPTSVGRAIITRYY